MRNSPQQPRGAGGRRRYVPDWPRHIGRNRRRMGQTMLLLGAFILIISFGALRLRDGGGGADEAGLVGSEDRWRLVAPAEMVEVAVERVIDGDTLDVLTFDGSSLRVRLFGVNAPETGERCAEEATALLTSLAGGAVRLLPDERLEDAGGRQLRYLFTAEGISIDAALIAGGVARAWRADGALRDQLVALEEETSNDGRGCLWAGQ